MAESENLFQGQPLHPSPRRGKPSPHWWLILSCLIVATDYVTGPDIQLSILYVVPVALATWYSGWRWGVVLACSLPLVRVVFLFLWVTTWSVSATIFNSGIRIVTLSLLVLLVYGEVQRRALLQEVKILRGLLPICSFCKKIRVDKEAWVPLEAYLAEHSEAELSHGFCPECMKEHYGKFFPPQQ
ncbi:MAG: hypothetical protein A2162_09995 [Deltaproteobacteria bacterium RBG_13_52_11b]|nr:MAG: hypothetical protein A2162_09995 [Deltaproteobacteria bacterium RBG_13_52_11b]